MAAKCAIIVSEMRLINSRAAVAARAAVRGASLTCEATQPSRSDHDDGWRSNVILREGAEANDTKWDGMGRDTVRRRDGHGVVWDGKDGIVGRARLR